MPLSRFLRRFLPRSDSTVPKARESGASSASAHVAAAYWLLLGRPPDDHGREQVRRLELGQPVEAVSKALLSSAEFRLRHATLTEGAAGPAALVALEPALAALGDDREFLAEAYRILLDRDPDPEGLRWHAGELARGVHRATAVWTMLASAEFESRYRRICPAGGRTPRDVQLCELANPAKWDNPDWMAVLKALGLPAEHRLAMHRKAYEFTQTAWGLRRLGALTDRSRVLSVGAGHEALAYWLANHAAAVVATDLYQGSWQSEGALEGDMRVLTHPEEFAPFAYRRERLRFLQMDGTRLGFRDGGFDIAYSLSSIEHFGGWAGARRAVEEMARVVRRGGHLVIATEWAIAGPRRDEVFQPDEIRSLLEIDGVELVEPIDDRVWTRYEAVPVDLRENPFETPHMLVKIDDTVFTSVIAFLRRLG